MATTNSKKTSEKKESYIVRRIKNPLPLLLMLALIYGVFEIFGQLVKALSLAGLVVVGIYTVGWLIFHPNAPKWFK